MEKLRKAWEFVRQISLAQAIALAAGVGLLYLLRDRVELPTDIDGWKQVVDFVIWLLAAIATAGAVANGKSSSAPASTSPPPPPPSAAGPAAGLILALAIAIPAQGCGSAIGTQARIAHAGLVTVEGIQRFADTNHAAAIEACPPPGAETRLPCIDAADAEWMPVGEGADGAGVALVAWIDSLQVARLAEGDVDEALALAMARAIEDIRPAFVLALCHGADLPDWLLPIFGIDPRTACGGE